MVTHGMLVHWKCTVLKIDNYCSKQKRPKPETVSVTVGVLLESCRICLPWPIQGVNFCPFPKTFEDVSLGKFKLVHQGDQWSNRCWQALSAIVRHITYVQFSFLLRWWRGGAHIIAYKLTHQGIIATKGKWGVAKPSVIRSIPWHGWLPLAM